MQSKDDDLWQFLLFYFSALKYARAGWWNAKYDRTANYHMKIKYSLGSLMQTLCVVLKEAITIQLAWNLF